MERSNKDKWDTTLQYMEEDERRDAMKELWKEIDEYLKNGQKITPMKLYMEKFNCDLKTAKNAIDERSDELWNNLRFNRKVK